MDNKNNNFNLIPDPKYHKEHGTVTTKASLGGYDPAKSGGKRN